ncbi:MAG: TlpA family protein disulfide reductase [Armatimonadetes bacterium]|nr:TlpA family protein disulfide reductase [Armatimonadota bacterium]
MKRILLACFLALAASWSLAQTADDAKAVIAKANKIRSDAAADRAAGKTVIPQEVNDKVKAVYEEALKTIDPGKIASKDAYEWARIFQMAGRSKECCDLAKRFLETGPADQERYQAMSLMAQSCNALGEADMLAMTLQDIPVPNWQASSSLASMTTNVYVDTIYEKQGLLAAMNTLEAVEKKMVLEDPKDYAKRMLDLEKARAKGQATAKPDADRLRELEALGVQANESQAFVFANKRAELLKDAGKKDEAINTLTAAINKMTAGTPAQKRAKMALTQMTLPGVIAPALNVERSYGSFKGLDALKGKVVIVDFFAHWCGPCIASFPDMEQMYSDLHGKGLEVVGLTTYYGYYQAENVQARDMPKDTEFGKMKDFIADHKIPWQVVYGDRSNFEAYGISGIPTTILIDRNGVVHEVHVGYSPESFKAFRAEVEKLVNGK